MPRSRAALPRLRPSCCLRTLTASAQRGEVDRLVALARDNGCDIIVGVGGGKVLDTAEGRRLYLESPVIICPHHCFDRCPVLGAFGALYR